MPNLFDRLPQNLPDELIEVLVENPQVRVERIVSTGQASPPGFWYDQAVEEWVLVLRGEAKLQLNCGALVHLKPGDYLHIPAHEKHRVAWTTPDEPTVWLAIHFAEPT